MHYWNYISIGLVLIWCLSPLGGQALIRVLSTVDIPTPSSTNLTYVNTRAGKYIANEKDVDLYGFMGFFGGFAALFGASILAPISVKNSSVDIWGNVKVPYQSQLTGPADQDGWVAVKTNETTPMIYSSMFGVPITAKFPDGNTSFYIESTYVELNCHHRNSSTFQRIKLPKSSWRVEVKDPEDLLSSNGPYRIPRNISSYQIATDKDLKVMPDDQKDLSGDYGSLWAVGYMGFNASDLLSNPKSEKFNTTLTTALDAISPQHFDEKFDPGSFLFQDRTGSKNLTNIFCIPSQRYVESLISCSKNSSASRTCSVVKQRNSKLHHMSTTVSILALPRIMHLVAKYLPSATVLKAGNQDFAKADFVTNYLVNQDPTYIQQSYIPHNGGMESDLATIPLDKFGLGLGQIINAFLHSTIFDTTRFLTGESLDKYKEVDPASLSRLKTFGLEPPSYVPAKSPADITDEIAKGLVGLTVTANSTTPTPTYKASWPWLIILFLASFIMFLAAIASITFSYMTTIPDYLGYVSSLVQESRFATGLEGHAELDGLNRSGLMKNRVVRFGDVGEMGDEAWGEAGVLGIGDVEGTRRVRRGKLYTALAR